MVTSDPFACKGPAFGRQERERNTGDKEERPTFTELLPRVMYRAVLLFAALGPGIGALGQEPPWEWVRHAGGSSYDHAYGAAADTSGNYYVAGGFRSTSLTFGSITAANTSTNSSDAYVVKLNGDGDALWVRTLGGVEPDEINGVATDAAGNCYACGVFDSPTLVACGTTLTNTSSDLDAFLVKYDAEGTCLWARQAGGNHMDGMSQVAADADGNVYVVGGYDLSPMTIGDTVLPQPYVSSRDIFLAKYTADGTFQWARRMGGVLTDHAYHVACDTTGGVYIAGNYSGDRFFIGNDTLYNPGNPYGFDGFLAKYDADGNELWARRIGSLDNDVVYGLSADPDGHTCVAGSFTDEELTMDTLTLQNSGTVDGFIAKFDPAGGVVWAVPVQGPDYEAVNAVVGDGHGGCLVTGVFRSAVSTIGNWELLDPDPGQYDLFVAWLDESGSPIWRKTAHGNDHDLPFGIALSSHSGVLIAGDFLGDSLHIGPNLLTNPAPPAPDIFIATLKDLEDIGVEDQGMDRAELVHFPDPASDHLVIRGLGATVQAVEILDVAARSVPLNYERIAGGLEVDVRALPPGVYVLHARTTSGARTVRFSVQR